MAINAYNAGTTNNLIDTTEKFIDGDMLVFDLQKNLFVKSLNRSQIATSDELTQLRSLLDQIDMGHTVEWDKIQNVPEFVTPSQLNLYATTSYVTQQITQAVTGGQIDLTGYVTQTELNNTIQNINTFDGDYNSLTNIPVLFDGDYNSLTNIPVLFDGDYNSLLNKPTLFGGSYNDLSDKPNLFSGNYNDLYNKPALFSGNYNDLYNQPIIPNDLSQLSDNSNLIFDLDYNKLVNTPTTILNFGITDGLAGQVLTTDGNGNFTFTSVSGGSGGFDGQWSSLTGTPTTLAGYGITDAFSGNYNDLTNKPIIFSGLYSDLVGKPTIPTDVNQLTDVQGLLPRFSGDYNDLTNKPTLFDGNYNSLTNKPTLFDGDYNSLTNKPTVPASITDLSIQDGTTGQVLTTDGAGNFSFTTVSAGTTINQISDIGDVSNVAPSVGQVLKWNGTQWAPASDTTGTGGTGISLSDISVSTSTASGSGALTYDNTTGVFNFTPAVIPSLAGYATELYVNQAVANSNTDLTPWSITQDGHFVPDTNITYDIGSPTQRVRDIYMSGSTLYFDEETLSKDNQGNLRWQGNDIRDYNQLKNKPDLSNLTSIDVNNPNRPVTYAALNTELDGYVSEAELAAALANAGIFSGDYNDLTNKPTIPGPQSLSLSGNVLSISDGNSVDLTTVVGTGGGTGTVDLTGYATQTYVQQQISTATLGSVANINDLTDVAIDGTETTNHVLMYNPLSNMWENTDLDETFATRNYVTEQLAQVVSGGQLDLSGYATESYVTQRLLERGDHFSGNYNDLVNRPQLFSGDYRDLINTPADNSDLRLVLNGSTLTLVNIEPEPDTVISAIDLEDLGAAVSTFINYSDVQNIPNIFSGNYDDLINKPVLFSGNYADLANKPYIPSIAGLATEQYVNDKHAEPTIYGDKTFKGSVTFENFTLQKTSTVSHTAQKREYVMAIQTNNNIPTEVLLSNSTRIAIPQNSTAMFKATFVAVSSTTSASFNIRGVINHSAAGSTQLIGGNILEVIADGGTEWIGDITADSVTDSLRILITGEAATTIDWTVFVELTEVKR